MSVGTFTPPVTDVRKPLMSVARICDAGHEVVFQSGGGYIKHTESGKITKFHRMENVYRFKVLVAKPVFSGWRPKSSSHARRRIPQDCIFEECGEEFQDMELECEEEEEVRELCVLRDLGVPTESEVGRHDVTHMPFRPVTSITRKWRVRSKRRCQKSSLTSVSWSQRERTLSPFKSLGIDGRG